MMPPCHDSSGGASSLSPPSPRGTKRRTMKRRTPSTEARCTADVACWSICSRSRGGSTAGASAALASAVQARTTLLRRSTQRAAATRPAVAGHTAERDGGRRSEPGRRATAVPQHRATMRDRSSILENAGTPRDIGYRWHRYHSVFFDATGTTVLRSIGYPLKHTTLYGIFW